MFGSKDNRPSDVISRRLVTYSTISRVVRIASETPIVCSTINILFSTYKIIFTTTIVNVHK